MFYFTIIVWRESVSHYCTAKLNFFPTHLIDVKSQNAFTAHFDSIIFHLKDSRDEYFLILGPIYFSYLNFIHLPNLFSILIFYVLF